MTYIQTNKLDTSKEYSSITIGLASPEAILARGAGVVPNSNLQLLFNAPTLRAFRFDWKMSPRSKEEAIRVNNIIRFFKQGMAAKKMQASTGGGAYFLGTPNVFDITFRTSKLKRELGNENISVMRMKTCACVGAAVNYTCLLYTSPSPRD